MKLVIPQAVIVANPVPQMQDGKPIHWAHVQYMGGEIRVPNPSKFNGNATDVEIEVRCQPAAKSFRDKATGNVSGFIAIEVRGVAILTAKVAKS